MLLGVWIMRTLKTKMVNGNIKYVYINVTEEKQGVFIPRGSVVTWKTGSIRVTEILSNDEIQVFKNLRPPVPEELILFNVF